MEMGGSPSVGERGLGVRIESMRIETMLLEQSQEAEFNRRANAGCESFEPRTRIVGVAPLKRG
jgi:hypothetical protein